MPKWNTKDTIVAVVFVAIAGAAFIAAPQASPDSDLVPGPWYSVLPPLVAICLAIMTGRVMLSLLLAVVLGGFLVSVPEGASSIGNWLMALPKSLGFIDNALGHFRFSRGEGLEGIRLVAENGWDNIQILLFVVLIMAMIGVAIAAGGLQGVANWLGQFARGPRSTQFFTFLMGLVLFIDDYANTMIVGSTMRATTDKNSISREKLAFLVDATSAPVAGLAIISTWVGFEVGLFADVSETLDLQRAGYAMLFDALPYRFYCVMMLWMMFAVVVSGRDFGPMAAAERRTRTTGAVAEPDAIPMTSSTFSSASPDLAARVTAWTVIVPVAALFSYLLGSIWLEGGGGALWDESSGSLFTFSAWRAVISEANSIPLLAESALIGLVAAAGMAIFPAGLKPKRIAEAALSGVRSSLLPVIILTLAWSIKEVCGALSTGPFMVALVGDSIAPAWFPAIVFVIAAVTSFSTGTSYGTMGILMPIAVPIVYSIEGGYGPATMITLAAVLDGSIFGDHCSPISDTTIMSSIASSCDHMHHVRTQLPYSLMVAGLALALGYVPAGFGLAPAWSFLFAFAVIAAVFFLLLPRLEAGRTAAAAEAESASID